MKMIELNQDELNYLLLSSFIPNKLKSLFNSLKKINSIYYLKITEEIADQVRDLCGEQLQITGFDEKYDLTYEGKILEALIDKFFIG